jgi:hypothetical protein
MRGLALLACFLTAVETDEPATFIFVRGSGPEEGRTEAYDPQSGQYRLKVQGVARFRVGSVADDLQSRPVVLRITGMIDRPEGPLTLEADGKRYRLHHEGFDEALFRVQRDAGVTTIEFLPKAKALLKPGATFRYIDYYRN